MEAQLFTPSSSPQVDVMLRDGFPAVVDALVAKGGLDIRLNTGEPHCGTVGSWRGSSVSVALREYARWLGS